MTMSVGVSKLEDSDVTLLSLDDEIISEVFDDEPAKEVVKNNIEHSGFERREEKRFPVKWSGSCQRLNKKLESIVTNDISMSGLGFWVAKPLKVGERLYVLVEASAGGNTVQLDAIVVVQNVVLSNDLFRCGTRFVSVSEPVKKQIGFFLNHGVFNPRKSWSN